MWTLPSGKVDRGEFTSEAAAREAYEEAGVPVAPLVALGSRMHPATGWRVVYVACRLLDVRRVRPACGRLRRCAGRLLRRPRG
ncbi:NUDIX domain-containing protein [Streptomyces parvulus]|uniref:NUDIX domain-containing protein n=1 Tax=Streptomyces parvulus TaxID=146923 RepID=UPI0033FCAE8D